MFNPDHHYLISFQFLAHPNCQQLLQQAWYRGIPSFFCRSKNRHLFLLAYFVLWTFCFPFVCILHMLNMSRKATTLLQQPINKFISTTISYCLFLLVISLDVMDTDSAVHRNPAAFPTPIQWLIIAWFLGQTLRFARVMMRKRQKFLQSTMQQSLKDGHTIWNVGDLALFAMFFLYVTLWSIGIAIHWEDKNNPAYRRSHLGSWDPLLLSDCAYSVFVILAFVRINAIFRASSSLGPLQLSMSRMAMDIYRFMFFFFVAITAFVMGVTKLYAPYHNVYGSSDEQQQQQQSEDFTR